MHEDYIEIMQYLGASDRTTLEGIKAGVPLHYNRLVEVLRDLTRWKWIQFLAGEYELTTLGYEMYGRQYDRP